MTPEQEVMRLNEAYVQAALAGDTAWYQAHLAEEFVCIESDGSRLDRRAFLAQTAQGSELTSYRLEQVEVRLYGEVALVRAAGTWVTRDGTPGRSRYTDVYVRSAAGWRAVSAQITRPAQAFTAQQEDQT